ncbi:MAG: PLDc N-terminal domain-containing protein [Actinobacteria bacterium]|nr:PLDc N-terminal domain-containing protein [Actinomycetota bacterium]
MEAIAGLMGLFMLAMMGMLVGGIVLWFWALVDLIRRPERNLISGSKALWAIVLVAGGPLGALVYMLVARPRAARAF